MKSKQKNQDMWDAAEQMTSGHFLDILCLY